MFGFADREDEITALFLLPVAGDFPWNALLLSLFGFKLFPSYDKDPFLWVPEWLPPPLFLS